ncbi:hypothetical protein E2C01_027448 [Portunus trituberculatus]|uniref:Uncharacterized protein n=1 Tax=Portunus trituberculatus TaxID=210409 RepID=A0A5B7ENR8_PORTR|nr:hypothetical protein [Portunus trituberculatus]
MQEESNEERRKEVVMAVGKEREESETSRTRSIKLSSRQWEDKLRSECSRLKAELDELHAEEKHLAVESMKVQKEQEIRKLKQSWELRQEEMTKEHKPNFCRNYYRFYNRCHVWPRNRSRCEHQVVPGNGKHSIPCPSCGIEIKGPAVFY